MFIISPENPSYVAYTTVEGRFAIMDRGTSRIVWRGSSRARAVELTEELNRCCGQPCGTPLVMLITRIAEESDETESK